MIILIYENKKKRLISQQKRVQIIFSRGLITTTIVIIKAIAASLPLTKIGIVIPFVGILLGGSLLVKLLNFNQLLLGLKGTPEVFLDEEMQLVSHLGELGQWVVAVGLFWYIASEYYKSKRIKDREIELMLMVRLLEGYSSRQRDFHDYICHQMLLFQFRKKFHKNRIKVFGLIALRSNSLKTKIRNLERELESRRELMACTIEDLEKMLVNLDKQKMHFIKKDNSAIVKYNIRVNKLKEEILKEKSSSDIIHERLREMDMQEKEKSYLKKEVDKLGEEVRFYENWEKKISKERKEVHLGVPNHINIVLVVKASKEELKKFKELYQEIREEEEKYNKVYRRLTEAKHTYYADYRENQAYGDMYRRK